MRVGEVKLNHEETSPGYSVNRKRAKCTNECLQVLQVTAPRQYTDEKGIPTPPESVTDLLSYPDEHKGKWLGALDAEAKGLDEQGVWGHNVSMAELRQRGKVGNGK